jgi:hypothetical protein
VFLRRPHRDVPMLVVQIDMVNCDVGQSEASRNAHPQRTSQPLQRLLKRDLHVLRVTPHAVCGEPELRGEVDIAAFACALEPVRTSAVHLIRDWRK